MNHFKQGIPRRERQLAKDITYMWNLKYYKNCLSMTQKQRYRTDFWLPRERRRREGWIGSLGLADATILQRMDK